MLCPQKGKSYKTGDCLVLKKIQAAAFAPSACIRRESRVPHGLNGR